MPGDDEPASRPLPRYLPTLTEVIAPGDDAASPSRPAPLEAMSAPPAPAAAAPPVAAHAGRPRSPSVDQVADAVLARLGPQLDRQIAETIGRVLHEQLLGLNGRVQKAVAELVREAVARDIAQHGLGADDGENP